MRTCCAQVTPYASDELVLIVPRGHELAKRREIGVEELYALSLVSLNQGSSVQCMQEKLLRRHGILWRHLHVEIVRSLSSASSCTCLSPAGLSLHAAWEVGPRSSLGSMCKCPDYLLSVGCCFGGYFGGAVFRLALAYKGPEPGP